MPNHKVKEYILLDTFYNGLKSEDRMEIDKASGGSFMLKTPEEARKLIDEFANNLHQFGPEFHNNEPRPNLSPQRQQNLQPRQILPKPQGESSNSTSQLEVLISKVVSSPIEFQEVTEIEFEQVASNIEKLATQRQELENNAMKKKKENKCITSMIGAIFEVSFPPPFDDKMDEPCIVKNTSKPKQEDSQVAHKEKEVEKKGRITHGEPYVSHVPPHRHKQARLVWVLCLKEGPQTTSLGSFMDKRLHALMNSMKV
ncbi:hypothetical protein COLO4_36403 [Corchorus olitorius]|uniref:Uncharacterized protein n=1 Tax=Corchorus olitorius TaxID=93759 RepID=A0A1R3G923_9ROSI|nr:hypothetical protein COLO4_36403 [Corchorus olitorius]